MINPAFMPTVLAASSLTAAPPAQAAPDPVVPDAEVQAVSAAGNDFGFRLLHLLATDRTAPPNANVFFSPFSVSQALTLALSGAGGKTRDDMAKTLELSALSQEAINAANARLLPQFTSDPKVQVSVANALWADEGLNFSPLFAADALKFYNAPATILNFQSSRSADTINTWVSKNTRGKITQIVAPDDLQSATNILTNAVYFHGDWETPFEPANTETKPFHLPSGGTKTIPLMERFDEMGYLDTPQLQIAALPYGAGRVVLYILLPKPGITPETVALALSAETDAQWRGAIQPTDVMLYLPRFKADTSTKLTDALSALGMGQAFGPAADFSSMTGRRTKLDAVLHVATLDVDEQSTTAAAATAVGVAGAEPTAPPPPVMRVDRPFIVLIRDTETGTLLFAGVIRDPK